MANCTKFSKLVQYLTKPYKTLQNLTKLNNTLQRQKLTKPYTSHKTFQILYTTLQKQTLHIFIHLYNHLRILQHFTQRTYFTNFYNTFFFKKKTNKFDNTSLNLIVAHYSFS